MKPITIVIKVPTDVEDKDPLKNQSKLVQAAVVFLYEKIGPLYGTVPGIFITSFENAKAGGIQGVVLAEKFSNGNGIEDFHLNTRALSQLTDVIILSEGKSYMASDFSGCISNTRAKGVIYRERKDSPNFLGMDGSGVPTSADAFLKYHAR
jgi:hypothetical protein